MIQGTLRNLATTVLLAASVIIGAALPSMAADYPHPGTVIVSTSHEFDALLKRLEKAISDNRMGLVAQASASRGAASRGVSVLGNAVLEVFRNDYAVRMLEASVPAGIEAPPADLRDREFRQDRHHHLPAAERGVRTLRKRQARCDGARARSDFRKDCS
jgi:hypothetical protein